MLVRSLEGDTSENTGLKYTPSVILPDRVRVRKRVDMVFRFAVNGCPTIRGASSTNRADSPSSPFMKAFSIWMESPLYDPAGNTPEARRIWRLESSKPFSSLFFRKKGAAAPSSRKAEMPSIVNLRFCDS